MKIRLPRLALKIRLPRWRFTRRKRMPAPPPAEDLIGPTAPRSITNPQSWAELEAWARCQPLLPKYWGLSKSAAIWDRPTLTAQYKQFRSVFELVDLWPMLLPWLALSVGIAGGLAASGVGFATQPQGTWTIGHTVVMTGFVAVLFVPAGLPIALRMRYTRAYARVFVLEFSDALEPWRITAVGMTRLPRLGYANSKGYFVGGTRDSGIRHGSVVVAIGPGDKPLADMTMHDIWTLMPVDQQRLTDGEEAFHGASARAAKAIEQRATEGGKIKYSTKRPWYGDLAETGMIVLCALLAVLTFLQVQTGYEVSLANLDPTALLGGAP